PAPRPMEPIPGAIKPMIIKGITNPKKLPNKSLKVANTLITHSGAIEPMAIPKTIAAIILAKRPKPFMMFSSLIYVQTSYKIGFYLYTYQHNLTNKCFFVNINLKIMQLNIQYK